MSEEIRKQNAELNDAELTGVSGGFSEKELDKAWGICARCRKDVPNGCDGGDPFHLADYVRNVGFYLDCPFYKGPVG